MTQDEALIYFPIQEDDLEDLYDEKLFELKQFFLNRFPMSKLIDSRLKKFQKVEEAYTTLGGILPDSVDLVRGDFPEFRSINEVVSWYNQEKNAMKLRLSSARCGAEVKAVLSEYLRLTLYYAEQWKIPVKTEDAEVVKMAVEPNPMDIQEALNALGDHRPVDSHLITIEFISSLPDENHLKSEAKRLSLWLNFESNEQSVR